MSLLPWRSYQLESRLPPGEVLRLFHVSTPPCRRWQDLIGEPPYFCGHVDPARGCFFFQRNRHRKGRVLFPLVRGAVRPALRGSIIDVSVTPNIWFWLLLAPPLLLLAFIPFAVLVGLAYGDLRANDLVMIFAVPLGGVVVSWWLWGPPIVVNYLSLPRYRDELQKLLNRMSERTPEGWSVLEAPETPQQRQTKEQLRKQAGQNALKVIAAFFAVMGLLLFLVGAKGLLTGELTMKNENQSVTVTGPQGIAGSQALLAIGSALAIAGVVGWLVSRRDPKDRSWPLPDTILIILAGILMLMGMILGIRSFW